MPEYRVHWAIDVEAASPREAAELAREMQIAPETTATMFEVDGEQFDVARPERGLVPDFSMEVRGQYLGNAYTEWGDYRITARPTKPEEADFGGFTLYVWNSSGGCIGKQMVTANQCDGLQKISSTHHDLTVYEDDWEFPVGTMRAVTWQITTDSDHEIVLHQSEIDYLSEWSRYLTGENTWDWDADGSEWKS